MVKPKATPQKIAQPVMPVMKPATSFNAVKTIKPHQHAMVELCEKHKQYKVAYEPHSGQQMCNQCLFEIQAVKAENAGEPQKMFTALITRDLKKKFDQQYKTYKDSLCDVAEVDPENVKKLMISQVKEFFATVRGQVKFVRSDIGQRVKTSQALVDLERLIAQNEEYFGPNAGFDLAREKDQFDQKLARGRFATVVKRQEYYNSIIKILDEANNHMQQTLKEANDLLFRVVQCDPELKTKAERITMQIIDDHIRIDTED